MNTQTHIIMGAALFGRKLTSHAWAGIAGGILPDLPMYVVFLTLKFVYKIPDFFIFTVAYFDPAWQIANAVAHSLIMWPLLAITGWLIGKRTAASWPVLLAILASSATLHSIIDFLLHREDAHMHFWPLTAWRFVSPVSYWNPMFYGNYVQIFEAVLGLAMVALLFTIYRHWLARIAMAVGVLAYLGPPIYFRAMCRRN